MREIIRGRVLSLPAGGVYAAWRANVDVSEMEMTIFVTGRKRLTVAAFGNNVSGNGFQITPDNHEVTLRSFFGTFVPNSGTRPD